MQMKVINGSILEIHEYCTYSMPAWSWSELQIKWKNECRIESEIKYQIGNVIIQNDSCILFIKISSTCIIIIYNMET